MDNLTVLSLFGGMEVFRQSFKDMGVNIIKYYSSEIYEPSIKIAKKNHNDITQVGDITKLSKQQIIDMGKIDIIGFGFPCKNLSKTVINNIEHNQGLMGRHSKLFYEAIKILGWIKEINPNVLFLCENVYGMPEQDKNIITEYLGVKPILIDSGVVSAQERPRYYWTNISEDLIIIPDNKGLVIKDVMELHVNDKYYYNVNFDYYGDNIRHCADLKINGHDIIKRVYNINFKAPALTRVTGGNHQKKIYINGRCRKLTPLEYERLQTMPDNYTEGVSDTARYCMCGDAWTKEVIDIFVRAIKKA
jgi:DNA (cytosine-5)-methyltransferase 3A